MNAAAVRFGVVIPTYNRADLIAATLQSVLAQEQPAARIIVVDDGSTDDTVARARAFAPAVTVLEQTNAGPGAARNRGIDAADDCDYIAFLDSDDLFLPWTLATYAQAIARHDRPAFLLSSATEFRHDDELAQLRPQPISTQAFPDYYASSDADYWIGCSVVCVRRCFAGSRRILPAADQSGRLRSLAQARHGPRLRGDPSTHLLRPALA